MSEQIEGVVLPMEPPQVRHINRVRRGMQWLGPAIEKPRYLIDSVPLIGPKEDLPEIVA